jgi:hypothetical protein
MLKTNCFFDAKNANQSEKWEQKCTIRRLEHGRLATQILDTTRRRAAVSFGMGSTQATRHSRESSLWIAYFRRFVECIRFRGNDGGLERPFLANDTTIGARWWFVPIYWKDPPQRIRACPRFLNLLASPPQGIM